MSLFEKDPAAYNQIADKLSTDRALLESKEEAWLEVEMKREALDR